jgi:outer membrane murein-binding lipoprotein Lpp
MNARFFLPLVFSALLLSGCFKSEEQTKEFSTIKAQVVEQASRIQEIEERLVEINVSTLDAGKTIDTLVEYVEAIRSELQAVSDSRDVVNMLKEGRKSDFVALELKINEVADHVQKLSTQVADAGKATVAAPVVVQPKPVTPAPVAAPVKKKSEPTFDLIGIEYRGQEPFLALIERGGKDLSSVKLLQPSDSFGEWRLKSFDANRAVFVIDGQDFVIPLP